MAETQRTPAAALSEVHPHPAAQAWRASGGALAVERVESLRQGRHCRVDRLVIDDADERSVIAKWQDRPYDLAQKCLWLEAGMGSNLPLGRMSGARNYDVSKGLAA